MITACAVLSVDFMPMHKEVTIVSVILGENMGINRYHRVH